MQINKGFVMALWGVVTDAAEAGVFLQLSAGAMYGDRYVIVSGADSDIYFNSVTGSFTLNDVRSAVADAAPNQPKDYEVSNG